MSMDYQLFPGKSLGDLFQDIYRNQKTKKQRISELIHEIRSKVETPKDMAILYPVVKDLVDTSVKNDDALVKMAVVAQRLISAENKGEGETGFLTEKEKEELLQIAREQAEKVSQELSGEITTLESDAKSKMSVDESESN